MYTDPMKIMDAEYQKKTLKKYLILIFQQKIWGLIKDRDSGLQSVAWRQALPMRSIIL